MDAKQLGKFYKPSWTLDHNQDFLFRVQQGLVPGHRIVKKFGENPDVDTATTPEDIIEFGGAYTYDADGTAPIASLISDNIGDTGPMQVQGLDINGDQVTQTITMTGTTRAALTTPLWRVFRKQYLGATDLLGTAYCYVGTGGVPLIGDIRAIVTAGNNQTLMSVYTIPNKEVGLMYHEEIGTSRSLTAGEAQCSYAFRKYGGTFATKKRLNLSNAGTSIYQEPDNTPDVIPGKSDIRFRVGGVSANNTGVFATFNILLIDERLFADEFLASIGQPGY